MFRSIVCFYRFSLFLLFLMTDRFLMTSLMRINYQDSINRIQQKPYETDKKYGTADKCEIRIITNGVCSVNNQLVKPKIVVKQAYKFKDMPIHSKSTNPEIRFRDTKNVVIDEQKANSLVDQFLIQFKEHFGREVDQMVIPELGNFTLDDVGSMRIYELKLNGLSNIKRMGSVSIHSDSQRRLWTINANLFVENIIANFKVDAKLKTSIFIRGWTLQVLIKMCKLNAILEYDSTTNLMSISSLTVNSIDGFNLNSENLSWPFTQVVQHILDFQMKDLKRVISFNAQKYFSQTLKSFDVKNLIKH